MSMDNLSLSDIASVTRNNDDFGSGNMGFFWIFALLMLAGGGFGGLGGNGVQQADLQRAIDLNSIQEGQRDIESRVQEIGSENISAIKDAQYGNLGEIRNLQAAVSAGFANAQNCCCETKQAIMENRYLDAQNASNIMANSTANAQKILDAITGNRMADLQARINQLETANIVQNATAGVVKYPMSTSYAVPSPCFNTCG